MLETLNQVQRRDLDIDALVEERGQTPGELLELQRREQALRAELAETDARFQALRAEVNRNDLDLKSLDAQRKRAAQGALEAASSKEASQYQNQEMQFSTRYQELEEDTLPLIERLEGLEAEVTRLQNELAELTPELEAVVQAENDRVAAVEAKINSLSSERNEVASAIETPLLKQYEQVRKARRGVGLVEIVDNQRCGGCNVRLPIHVVQKARSGKGITRCPSCGRILWVKEV